MIIFGEEYIGSSASSLSLGLYLLLNTESAYMKRELVINGRFLTQQRTGVQSFAHSVCEELKGKTEFTVLVPTGTAIKNLSFADHVMEIGQLKGHLWEQMSLPTYLRKHKGAFLLNLCNTGPLLFRDQLVVIHDLAFLENPDWFSASFAKYYSWLMPKIVGRSKLIGTVSQTIEADLRSHFSLRDKNIVVLGNKVNSMLLSANSIAPGNPNILPGKYFLMLGSMDPRKNFSMVEELFKEKFPDVRLVIAGGTNSNFKIVNSATDSKNIIRLGYTSTENLRWLYENALGFINPSLYEGFGIPNLEAFALSCPVFCSDISVFREVCAKGANYFDPTDPETLYTILQSVLNNKLDLSQNVKSGYAIFEKYQGQDRADILLNAISL